MPLFILNKALALPRVGHRARTMYPPPTAFYTTPYTCAQAPLQTGTMVQREQTHRGKQGQECRKRGREGTGSESTHASAHPVHGLARHVGHTTTHGAHHAVDGAHPHGQGPNPVTGTVKHKSTTRALHVVAPRACASQHTPQAAPVSAVEDGASRSAAAASLTRLVVLAPRPKPLEAVRATNSRGGGARVWWKGEGGRTQQCHGKEVTFSTHPQRTKVGPRGCHGARHSHMHAPLITQSLKKNPNGCRGTGMHRRRT